ncbi:MAG: nicotinate (nicotinamide) nucleotide adenylyltransferase [Leptospiraceae bacterium]|nr:nicotinate (nicotinamide) nucleotide adenylyltransferase [Leptospiraceae bacterium]MDW7975593.1 nicotinate (nicotinamide) nucleotide adenylyltransferase [Leptospiraceae bacterium]
MISYLVYGGSYNPIHYGHLKTIEFVLKTNQCEEVWIVPTYRSPFKLEEEYAPAEKRYKMIQIAIESYFSVDLVSKVKLWDWEIQEKRIYYTVETLRKLPEPEKTGILIGADSLLHLEKWREIDWILQNFSFYIVQRAEHPKSLIESKIQELKMTIPYGKFHLLLYEPPNCSSTKIRELIKKNVSYQFLKDCLPYEVYLFIKNESLYF